MCGVFRRGDRRGARDGRVVRVARREDVGGVFRRGRDERAPGDVVGIRTGALMNAARNSHVVTGEETVAPPNRAERPVAVLSAPDALGPCDNASSSTLVGIDGGGAVDR